MLITIFMGTRYLIRILCAPVGRCVSRICWCWWLAPLWLRVEGRLCPFAAFQKDPPHFRSDWYQRPAFKGPNGMSAHSRRGRRLRSTSHTAVKVVVRAVWNLAVCHVWWQKLKGLVCCHRSWYIYFFLIFNTAVIIDRFCHDSCHFFVG